MGSVILAALCVAGFAIIFRVFERQKVALLPAIAINYSVAFFCGLIIAPPWSAVDWTTLLLPASMLGSLFVLIFSLQGISAQKVGAARTTIAGRMSLVLTIAGAVILFNEQLNSWTILGIVLALGGLLLTSVSRIEHQGERSWLLPLLIFLCCGAADISVTVVQRLYTTSGNASVFPTLCFGASAAVSAILFFFRCEQEALAYRRTWLGGLVLGVVNYASLLFLVLALDAGEHAASVIFPAMNILSILFATAAGLLLFRERLSIQQWCGIGLCIASLALIMEASA